DGACRLRRHPKIDDTAGPSPSRYGRVRSEWHLAITTTRRLPMTRTLLDGFSRRTFLTTGSAALGTLTGGLGLPGLSRANDRPAITHGLQSGDASLESAVVWARVDRPA